MANKLNFKNVDNAAKKVFTKREILIDLGGNNYSVLVDTVFSSSKIRDYVLYLSEARKKCNELGLIQDPLTLINLSILKTFTDIQFTGDVRKDLQMFSKLIDLEVVKKVFDVIPEGEIKKINDFVNTMKETLPKATELFKNIDNEGINDENIQ